MSKKPEVESVCVNVRSIELRFSGYVLTIADRLALILAECIEGARYCNIFTNEGVTLLSGAADKPMYARIEIFEHKGVCHEFGYDEAMIFAAELRNAVAKKRDSTDCTRSMWCSSCQRSRRSLMLMLWCVITDHDYCFHDYSRSEPYCRRCGTSVYWPVRRTFGRLIYEIRHVWNDFRKDRNDDIPF